MSTDDYQRRKMAFAAIALADKIESDFIAKHGGLATYIIACSREEAADALVALSDADPTDTKEIQKLQNIINRHRQHMEWLAVAADRGREAWKMLDADEQETIANAIDPNPQENQYL